MRVQSTWPGNCKLVRFVRCDYENGTPDAFSLIVYDLIRLQICKVCQKEFANVYRLQRHMISHDESAVLRRFKCADCGKAFKFKHHLKVCMEVNPKGMGGLKKSLAWRSIIVIGVIILNLAIQVQYNKVYIR